MSWIRIWVHMVFSTYNREPYLNTDVLRKQLFEHIKQNANGKNLLIDTINGYQEHIHCLISLGKDQSISKVAQLIKGESSFWMNQNKLIKYKFTWQDDYWAVGVSESHVKSIRQYILNQEDHHKHIPFSEEIRLFMQKYNLKLVKENWAKALSNQDHESVG